MSFASGRADARAGLPGLGAIHEVFEEKENRAHKKATQKFMSNKGEEILEASDHGSNHAFAGRGSVARLIAPIRAQSSAGSAQRGLSPALAHTSEGSTYSRNTEKHHLRQQHPLQVHRWAFLLAFCLAVQFVVAVVALVQAVQFAVACLALGLDKET